MADDSAIRERVDRLKMGLDDELQLDRQNVGVNVGTAAGQSVPHRRIRVTPRYRGDMENSNGGVRGVIPDRQQCRKTG